MADTRTFPLWAPPSRLSLGEAQDGGVGGLLHKVGIVHCVPASARANRVASDENSSAHRIAKQYCTVSSPFPR